MKNIRIIGGILFILGGIAIMALHFCKVVPSDWESYYDLTALVAVWAYTGPFLGCILSVAGFALLGGIDAIYRKMFPKD